MILWEKNQYLDKNTHSCKTPLKHEYLVSIWSKTCRNCRRDRLAVYLLCAKGKPISTTVTTRLRPNGKQAIDYGYIMCNSGHFLSHAFTSACANFLASTHVVPGYFKIQMSLFFQIKKFLDPKAFFPYICIEILLDALARKFFIARGYDV